MLQGRQTVPEKQEEMDIIMCVLQICSRLVYFSLSLCAGQ